MPRYHTLNGVPYWAPSPRDGWRQPFDASAPKTRDELLLLYETRLNAYERYAHYTLENDASIEEAVSRLCSVLLPRQL